LTWPAIFLNGETFGYINIYVLQQLHIIVHIFDFKMFKILCEYENDIGNTVTYATTPTLYTKIKKNMF